MNSKNLIKLFELVKPLLFLNILYDSYLTCNPILPKELVSEVFTEYLRLLGLQWNAVFFILACIAK